MDGTNAIAKALRFMLANASRNKIVPLAVRNGTVHDVFQIPLNMDPGVAVAEGWVQPWDDYIHNIDEWLAGFPSGVYLPGVNQFDGKTYGVCLTANKRTGTCLLYSSKYMSEAGYDPQAGRMTYSDSLNISSKQCCAASMMSGSNSMIWSWRGSRSAWRISSSCVIFMYRHITQAP